MMRAALAVLGIMAGILLVLDASLYSYRAMDPALGLNGGCFTLVEQGLGLKKPSGVRDAERIVGIVLVLASLVGVVVLGSRRRIVSKGEDR